jgi:hypothetical protein
MISSLNDITNPAVRLDAIGFIMSIKISRSIYAADLANDCLTRSQTWLESSPKAHGYDCDVRELTQLCARLANEPSSLAFLDEDNDE